MKIRSGFVSNSSSSSFVVVASKETVNNALKMLSPFGAAVVKTECIRKGKYVVINGMNTLISHGTNNTEDFGNEAIGQLNIDDDADEFYDKAEEAQEQWGLFCQKVNELGGYAEDSGY